MKIFSGWVISTFFYISALYTAGASPAFADQGNSGTEGSASENSRHTFVLVHGASGGGWDWKTIDVLLTSRGHEVYRPTLTGLGEKVHLNSPEIDLTTHVTDIANVILFEDLSEVVLVGHSYGGMVITGLWPSIAPDHDVVDGIVYFSWLDPDRPVPGDVPQSLRTFTEPVSFNNPDALQIPATYIAFIAEGQTVQARSSETSWKNAEARGWTIRTLESDHNAQRSHPEELAALLEP